MQGRNPQRWFNFCYGDFAEKKEEMKEVDENWEMKKNDFSVEGERRIEWDSQIWYSVRFRSIVNLLLTFDCCLWFANLQEGLKIGSREIFMFRTKIACTNEKLIRKMSISSKSRCDLIALQILKFF